MLLGAFIASAIPLGIDQVTSGSNTNISAFVTWLGWASFCGFSIPGITGSVFYNCTHLMESEVRMIMSLLPVLLLSVGLILDFHFHHKLVKEPVTVNPVSHIFKVLKYAAKHKYPVQRSAFTYCENERPTRLDYGKSKYGGPFTTKQVEDVKTFRRVLLVIFAISTVLTSQDLWYSWFVPHREAWTMAASVGGKGAALISTCEADSIVTQ
jgi:peptide/histidine transporter 3/4